MTPSETATYRPEGNSDGNVTVRELFLNREDEAGLVFLSCKELPDLFIAAKDQDDLRRAIDRGLKNAFGPGNDRVQVYTNGKIDGPAIDVMVKLTR